MGLCWRRSVSKGKVNRVADLEWFKMAAPWPPGFQRIPNEPWTRSSLEELALGYDTVERHGWYRNLDPTVEDLAERLKDGEILIDYSGGTGILIERFLARIGDRDIGIVNVDSSEKFLRLALEKLKHDERVAFRHIQYLRDEKRIQTLQKVLEGPLLDRGVDMLVSTNAIHLYYGLDDTLASWYKALRPDGLVHVQSGNIGVPDKPDDAWIIDETVEAVQAVARKIVAEDDHWADYRDVLDDEKRMAAHARLRQKFFLPVRPLDHYKQALQRTGFQIERVDHQTFDASVSEWNEFLSVYHEGVLGWIGGCRRIEGQDPSLHAIADRKALLEVAMKKLFEGQESFPALWTYIVARRP